MGKVAADAGTWEDGREFGRPRLGPFSTERLIHMRRHPVFGKLAHLLLRYLSTAEVPSEVSIGPDLVIHHHGFGLVVHPRTVIGARVHLFHNVTVGVGRDRIWEPRSDWDLGPLVIEDDAWLCAGATVLAGEGELRVARGTVVGANSVLRESTGPWEIWAGAPARCVGKRQPSIWIPAHARDPLAAEGVIWLPDADR